MGRSLILVLWIGVGALTGLTGSISLAQERLTARAAVPSEASKRDAELQRLAAQQAQAGDWIASLRTLGGVSNPRQLAQSLGEVQSVLSQGSAHVPGAGGGTGGGTAGEGGVDRSAPGGPGGGSFADFFPLMDLIQATISPDMWEEAGGTSTIRPYVAGIVVDPTGLVTDMATAPPGDDLLANIAVLLAQESQEGLDADSGAVQSWRLPARHRCVSLRGVARQVVRQRLSGVAIDDELRHLAGLSRIQYVVLLPQQRDVVLVGPVGGIQSHQGWFRDRQSGLPALRLDFLTACLTAVIAGQPLGCSIDPTPQSLAAAAKVGTAIRDREVPLGMAEEALRQALGEQSIRVFGIAGDTPLAYLMVQADRHMKRLSLGLEPMPRGIPNYLDLVTKHIDRGPPDGQLLRLWFTASRLAVRVCGNAQVYELAGRPMKLSSETQLSGPHGERLDSPDDIRLVEFVNGFNKNLGDIIWAYPAYGALQSVYEAAGIAEILRRSDAHPWIAQLLAPLLLDDASAGVLSVPRRVESIATGHWVKQRGKRHFILLASGGVRVEPSDTVRPQFESYPAIEAMAALAQPPDDQLQRWWWDAR